MTYPHNLGKQPCLHGGTLYLVIDKAIKQTRFQIDRGVGVIVVWPVEH
ncbi:MAG: hypothetical protein AAF702_04005 [Chloroflexota bacterium]